MPMHCLLELRKPRVDEISRRGQQIPLFIGAISERRQWLPLATLVALSNLTC